MTKTSRATGAEEVVGAGADAAVEFAKSRFGVLAEVAGDEVAAGVSPELNGCEPAVFSIAPASLCRAPGRCLSKHGIPQKTYPVRGLLQVDTLQT